MHLSKEVFNLMNQQIPIHDLVSQFNITSRTLRYWEQKELFKSSRDTESNWRVYDNETIEIIRLVVLLRELDIPIRDIKKIIDSKKACTTANLLENKIRKLEGESNEIIKKISLLNRCLGAVNTLNKRVDSYNFVEEIEKVLNIQIPSKKILKCEWEGIVMTNNPILSGSLRIVTLPAMRVAVCNVISDSPEDKAISNILKWAEEENLMGTARMFGFNTTPYSLGSKEYGWAACITIPEQVQIPEYFEEKHLPGGLYASFNSTNEVYDSWQTLMKLLKECGEYEVDKSRPCLEEHIPSGEWKKQGYDFYLNLLEPVRKNRL